MGFRRWALLTTCPVNASVAAFSRRAGVRMLMTVGFVITTMRNGGASRRRRDAAALRTPLRAMEVI
jgi:hypothetical protein